MGVPQTNEPISAASGPKFTILWGHVEEILLFNKVFPIVDMCLSCEDIARQSLRWCPDGELLAILRPVYSAIRVQHVSDLHPKFALRPHHVYIGWSDVTYLWSQCDRHFVGQHVVLCVVKWWRFVALFEWNWISWFKNMSVLSLSYWESDFYWRHNNKHFAELAPQNGKQPIWRNYVPITLCMEVW